jgi:AcrR family transcriptional regulator
MNAIQFCIVNSICRYAVDVPAPQRTPRPTRAETRERLLQSAAEVFIEKGIGATSIDDIAAAAGFSRGAVYSNFDDKDELVMALIRKMADESVSEVDSLVDNFPDPDEYIRETQRLLFDPNRPAGRHHPVLSQELMLYALRNPAAQPILQDRLERVQDAIFRAIEANATGLGLGPATNRRQIAAMINAMDDGFSLHAMIDPSRDPLAAFAAALDFLAEAGAAISFVERMGGDKRQATAASVKKSTTKEARS